MHAKTAPHVTIENVTYVRFAPIYVGPVESKEQVELRLLALSYAAANKELRAELETALRLIAWIEARSGTSYGAACGAHQAPIADSGCLSQAPPRALETS